MALQPLSSTAIVPVPSSFNVIVRFPWSVIVPGADDHAAESLVLILGLIRGTFARADW